ncbi:ATP-binding protein [Oscillatoria sp. FACHB-1406]|uniref:sensor histidine kinase n=1 Tax=Oscillatoria sp. FACHB-1406 TaxID=2692846 RepID=UPI0016829860|nr:ATP-binding protein [Oscillatoria sp. FACHB-1406]MBD2578588.1 PAS domain-containing protein [Oscillatoria sp. FACHB-1406]
MMNAISLQRTDGLAERIIDRNPLTASAEISLQDAVGAMARASSDYIFVVEPEPTGSSRFLGGFSARDAVRAVALGVDLAEVTLRESLSPDAPAIRESEVKNLETILALFRHSQQQYLPAIGDRGELVGALALPMLLEALSELNLDEIGRQSAEQSLLEQRLYTSEARLRVLIESVRDIVLVVEAEGPQLEVIPTHPAIAYDPDTDLIGQTIARFTGETTAEDFVRPVRDALARGETVSFEYSLKSECGEIWYDARISPLSEQSALWVARDITQRKRAEAQVIKALEKERELNELKSGFISMASHEFRTPLSVIKSSAQLLERYDWERSEQLQYLQQIQASVEQMTALMEDVLFLGKTEAARVQFQPEPLDAIAFCRNLVYQMQLAAGKQHSILFDCAIAVGSFSVCLDKKLLRQILSNLLANAIAYSPQGSIVRLSLSLEANSRIIFEVKDSGFGIPREAQSHLFESFYRAGNVSHIAGTGLGLTIVKQCVDLHRGAIAYESQLDIGTTFRVSLPFS